MRSLSLMGGNFQGECEDPRDEVAIGVCIERIRPALMGYVRSLLPQSSACDDIVQETCIFLWERRDEVMEEGNCKALAFKVAWFKVLSHRRDLQRQRVITFSEDMLHRIAGAAEDQADQVDLRAEALRVCLSERSAEELQLLRLKYQRGESLADHARQLGWKPNRLQKALSRIRLVLRHCVESRLSQTR